MTMTMDYRMHHHRCCRYVTSVSISDGTSFDPSSFLIICPIDVPSFDPIHGPSNYPSLSRGSILHPNDLNVVWDISLDELNAREILTTSLIPTISALTINPEQQPLHKPNGVPNSEPRRCTDNLPSLTIGIDSSAPSPEPKHLLKLQLDNLFSMTVDYGLHHHHQCESVISAKANDGPFIDSSFDPSHGPINYPSITCPSFVPSGDPFLVGVQICIYLLLILN